MAIHFACHECERKLKVRESMAGSSVLCPNCGQRLDVPDLLDSGALPQFSSPESGWSTTSGRGRSRTGAGARGVVESEIDMTPMVDMTFLLLIFFMITASFSLQKSIEMPAPEQQQAGAQGRSIEEIDSDEDYIVVRIDDENMFWVEDREAASEQEMLVQLREAREQNAAGRVPNRLLVLASGDALHERVVAALDAGTAVGMDDVRLATVDDDEF